MSRTVATVSDTVLGYGSSQILSITTGLAQSIGGGHRIFQPFVPHRSVQELNKKGYCIETVSTVEHPWSVIGRVQYLRQVAKWLNTSRPDILVLPNYNIIQIIGLLDYRPMKIIHLSLETLDQFGQDYMGDLLVKKIKQHVQEIDIWIFPERNRAILDCHELKIPFDRVCLFYNVTANALTSLPENERNGRIIYAGSVDFDRTAAGFFSKPSVASKAIDIFGSLSGSDKQKQDFFTAVQSARSRLRYFGEIPASGLASLLPQYAYSLVYWRPSTWALRNAAPNKFFEAISAGVPVISAPHPQCVSLIKRYGCGISLKDWGYDTFASGLKTAIRKIGSTEYQDMVAGCKEAYVKELNLDHQLEKVLQLVERK